MSDKTKKELCEKNNVLLLIASYKDEYLEFPRVFKAQLMAHGFPIQGIDFDSPIDMADAYIKDDRIHELKEALDSRDLELLTHKFLTVTSDYEIRCRKCGHQFSAPANRYLSKSREPAGCNRCNRSSDAALARFGLGIDGLRSFAEKHGGNLLSSDYQGSDKNYWWACKNPEHLYFQAAHSNLRFRNQFCPYCELRQVRNDPVNLVGTTLWKFGREPLIRLEKDSKTADTKCTRCSKNSIVDVQDFLSNPTRCCEALSEEFARN
jgi:hypothetical protein